MRNHHFKVGDEVAHELKLTLKMYVDKIIKQFVEKPGTKLKPEGGYEMETKSKIIGIQCHWFKEDNNDLQKEIFHSRELVPWEIAKLGREMTDKWMIGTFEEIGDHQYNMLSSK